MLKKKGIAFLSISMALTTVLSTTLYASDALFTPGVTTEVKFLPNVSTTYNNYFPKSITGTCESISDSSVNIFAEALKNKIIVNNSVTLEAGKHATYTFPVSKGEKFVLTIDRGGQVRVTNKSATVLVAKCSSNL